MATDKTYTTRTIGPELRRVAKRLGKATVGAMWTAAQLGRTRAVVAIGEVMIEGKPRPPVDTGQLRRSYMVTRITGGAVLENVAPHAAVMEFGARPFTPPLAPLISWAERKLRGSLKGKPRPKRDKKPGKVGSPKSKRLGKRRAMVMALALGTRKAIRRRGLHARGFHAAAMQFAAGDTEKALLKALRKVTR